MLDPRIFLSAWPKAVSFRCVALKIVNGPKLIVQAEPEGYLAPWAPRLDAKPLPEDVVGSTSGPVATGARVFYDKGCEFCHMISGRGGIRGPDLSYVGDRLTRDKIATRIFSGAANMPSYKRKAQCRRVERSPLFPGISPTDSLRRAALGKIPRGSGRNGEVAQTNLDPWYGHAVRRYGRFIAAPAISGRS
jgi:hypothetical protein